MSATTTYAEYVAAEENAGTAEADIVSREAFDRLVKIINGEPVEAPRANALMLPLYASKPQRRVAGVDAVAVTLYASDDKTVKEVALFSLDGTVYLGTVHYRHQQTVTKSRGWSLESYRRYDTEIWSSLAAVVIKMAKRHDVDLADHR